MATLVQLEPVQLRRLLRAGLRRGATMEQLAEIFLDGWGWQFQSREAQALLGDLQERGWLLADGSLWRTRFGLSQAC
jgi:hypothetical protein